MKPLGKHLHEYLVLRLLSRICGWVAVRVVFQDCDIELLPERDRSESRRLVWSSLESCC